MAKLLIIADDFTGALDTGVHFAARGAATTMVTDCDNSLSQGAADADVLIVAAETRHMPPEQAYQKVRHIVQNAKNAGISYIYKKTDSALRGNIGSELQAVMDGAGASQIAFLPALPKMSRFTRNGIHYIDGIPVAQSVFGKDPFEPVMFSAIADIIGQQADISVILHRRQDAVVDDRPGIHVYDAETDEDLSCIGAHLGLERLQLCAGCAGFATTLADILDLKGEPPQLPHLTEPFVIACGSVNPVTLRQMELAEQDGFLHVHLTPIQKLDSMWMDSDACAKMVEQWQQLAQQAGRFILDVNDAEDSGATDRYAAARAMDIEDVRIRVSSSLAQLVRRLLDGGLNGTLLCTGGDTLLALMRELQVTELTPICEMAAGVVLTKFSYGAQTYHIISKSGGFGEPYLFCKLAQKIHTGSEKEDTLCQASTS